MYDQAYVDFLAHFHGTRDYFECHEILEDRWKEDTPLDRQATWVGLIQIAVAMYHYRRENVIGAYRTGQKAYDILSERKEELSSYGLEEHSLFSFLNELLYRIQNRVPYQSMELPIEDSSLLEAVKVRCEELGCTYGAPSPLEDPTIIHRHTTRDRSEVIEEREKQLEIRKQNRI
ncbi:DUF309 domain-containing protein [Pontibacillus salicampi]|uniref:DUF309 domain-containing protein n=1 Tax=Pontibacillus salicampi TaxID=1449801 RepID=A0ABV6LLC4_9BACI